MVGVVTLIALNLGNHHLAVQDSILAKALINTGPAWVATQVDNRVVNPRAVGCTTLVGGNLCTNPNQVGIKRSSHIDGLREERSPLCICDAVVMVESVDIRNTEIFHRLLLNQTDPILPLFNTRSAGAGGIQDRAHLPLRNQRVEHCLIEFPDALRVALIDIDRIAAESVDNLLVSHLQQFLQLSLSCSVLLQH